MATITVRNLDDETVERLKRQAKAQGRSLEAEVRLLLTRAVRAPRWKGELGDLVASLDLESIRRGTHHATSSKRPPAPVPFRSPLGSGSEDIIASRERF